MFYGASTASSIGLVFTFQLVLTLVWPSTWDTAQTNTVRRHTLLISAERWLEYCSATLPWRTSRLTNGNASCSGYLCLCSSHWSSFPCSSTSSTRATIRRQTGKSVVQCHAVDAQAQRTAQHDYDTPRPSFLVELTMTLQCSCVLFLPHCTQVGLNIRCRTAFAKYSVDLLWRKSDFGQ